MRFLFGTVLALIVLASFLLAYRIGKNTKRFKWSEYLVMVVPGTCFVFVWAFIFEEKLAFLYVLSALVGFVLEYLLGFSYFKILNKHLWYYSRLKVEGYTSLLTLPFWGLAGIVFWLLIEIIGL